MEKIPAPMRLLLADDDVLFCEVLARALVRLGFEVRTAHDHAGVLALARQFQPQRAVVDLRIGAESGLALVSALLGQDPELRIIVLTGYASIATAVESIKLGAVHYLTKPAEPEEIAAAFERTQGDARVSPVSEPMSVRRLEWEHLQRVLNDHGGNISAAARALGLHRRSLQRKLGKKPSRR